MRCALLGALAGPCSLVVLCGCPLADLQNGSSPSSASWCQREQAGAAFCADFDEAGWKADGETLTLVGSYGPPLGSPSPARSTNASMRLGDIATSPPFSFELETPKGGYAYLLIDNILGPPGAHLPARATTGLDLAVVAGCVKAPITHLEFTLFPAKTPLYVDIDVDQVAGSYLIRPFVLAGSPRVGSFANAALALPTNRFAHVELVADFKQEAFQVTVASDGAEKKASFDWMDAVSWQGEIPPPAPAGTTVTLSQFRFGQANTVTGFDCDCRIDNVWVTYSD